MAHCCLLSSVLHHDNNPDIINLAPQIVEDNAVEDICTVYSLINLGTAPTEQQTFVQYTDRNCLFKSQFVSTFPLGIFSCGDQVSAPVKCFAGTFAAAGSVKCHSCPKGTFCPTNGLSMYVLCANGTYSDSEGRDACIPCDAGFRCPNVGMEAPQLCPNGTYSNITGALQCNLCPEGHR